MIIKIPQDKLPQAKLNTESLKSELAAALQINQSDIGYSLLRDTSGSVLEMEIEIPDSVNISEIVSVIESHNPEKSEIEEDNEKPTLSQRIEILEAKVLALEGK